MMALRLALLNLFALSARTSYLSAPSQSVAKCHQRAAASRRCVTVAQFGDEFAATADDDAAAAAQQFWDDNSFAEDPYIPPPPLEPTQSRPVPTRPIETITVGRVSGPFKRRRGYHAEVAVQHPGRSSTTHRLWFAHEVLQDVAKLRGARERHVDVHEFAEATVRYLQEQGVDLADPDWGMEDDNIPFSTEHLPLRTLFDYYAELPEYLAAATLQNVPDDEAETPVEEAENLARYSHEMEPGVEFPCLGALAPDGSGETFGPFLTGEPVYIDPATQPPLELEPAEAEGEDAADEAEAAV